MIALSGDHMTRSLLLLVAVGVIASGVFLHPHHAVGDVFDERQTLTLEGEIVALVYRNPHSVLHLEVADGQGAERTWAVEWRGVSLLSKGGVGPTTLRPGDHVVVCGNPGRDPGQFRLLLGALTRPADEWSAYTPRCDGD